MLPTNILSTNVEGIKTFLCSNFVDIQILYVLLSLYYCSCARQLSCWESSTSINSVCTGELLGYSIVAMLCAVVCEKELCWKRTKHAVKKNPTVTTQMFNVLHFRWTGHLPLAILYAPSASIWLLENSLHTLSVWQPWRHITATQNWLVLFLVASADTEGHFLHSHALPPQCVCRVSCQSVIVVNSLIVSGEVVTPLQKTFTVFAKTSPCRSSNRD